MSSIEKRSRFDLNSRLFMLNMNMQPFNGNKMIITNLNDFLMSLSDNQSGGSLTTYETPEKVGFIANLSIGGFAPWETAKKLADLIATSGNFTSVLSKDDGICSFQRVYSTSDKETAFKADGVGSLDGYITSITYHSQKALDALMNIIPNHQKSQPMTQSQMVI